MTFDDTLAFARRGYEYISSRCRELGADVFETRLLLRPTICMMGRDAAQLFYDDTRFERAGAAPMRLQKTLLGVGGVQGLDGVRHRHRKAMFLSLMTDESMARLERLTGDTWRAAALRWQNRARIVLFDEVELILCRAACAWAGVPLIESEIKRRTRDLGALIDGAGGVGPRYRDGRRARRRAEAWLGDAIERQRASGDAPAGSALEVLAAHRDLDGALLDPRIAAVELLNLLRPTVAIARFITFAALALHESPACRYALADDPELAELFVQEVRRFYPFFPAAIARVRTPFTWGGVRFRRGTRVLLDLHGTNRDPRIWARPDEFIPARFRDWDGDAFSLIPQGGGDHATGHRCAGEWLTIRLMKVALRMLTTEMTYQVPQQDLRIAPWRMPAIPRSRFVIERVRHVGLRSVEFAERQHASP
jgi:fatty-acid peroxygenase